jgi:glutaredoxin
MATFRRIKLYTIANCRYCHMARNLLAKYNINYEELDVSKDHLARLEMAEKSHQFGVPVLEVDDEIYVGFDRAAYEEALKISEA